MQTQTRESIYLDSFNFQSNNTFALFITNQEGFKYMQWGIACIVRLKHSKLAYARCYTLTCNFLLLVPYFTGKPFRRDKPSLQDVAEAVFKMASSCLWPPLPYIRHSPKLCKRPGQCCSNSLSPYNNGTSWNGNTLASSFRWIVVFCYYFYDIFNNDGMVHIVHKHEHLSL